MDDVEVAFCLPIIFSLGENVAQPLTSADHDVSSLPGEIIVGWWFSCSERLLETVVNV